MPRCRSAALTLVLACGFTGCANWESNAQGVAYVFSNHCGEDVTVQAVGSDDSLVLRTGESGSVQTVDQEPDMAFVVSGPAGTTSVQVIPGTSTFAIDDVHCPTDS